MTNSQLTDALHGPLELGAQKAEDLPAFGGFKLQHVKRELAVMLSHIGRDGIFAEYTRHDITHINKLLEIASWIIPKETLDILTPADCLLLTLAIYFHDFGMLVTRSEFEDRYKPGSSFSQFRDTVMLLGPSGKDLEIKLSKLTTDDRERFLYQEYIRHQHAKRIRSWITGEVIPSTATARPTADAIGRLMSHLPAEFRHDLGIVCESHHLDDLNDLKKYPVSQPYGDGAASTANVQYCAVILRTVDLLHMTTDRTPSVAFQLISPTDPISQREWAKQAAVRTVRAQPARDREGVVDHSAQPTVVEVFAKFKEPNGFFALTEFLSYVQKQLRQSYGWIRHSREHEGTDRYKFPWRDVDDSHVEATNFINRPFEFSIEQSKILDLLTGHTLYNETDVVVRELIQNALDATRVQSIATSGYRPRIQVSWNSATRQLLIRDNGTGMTQDIIESFLLKVGSSRYQDADFRKSFPSFSPISRFGIGLLSCFMIADEVDIYTASQEETDARHLALRSLHGKYLVRMVPKSHAVASEAIGEHGTVVSLTLRERANLGDVSAIVRKWVVLPSCPVEVIDGDRREVVGYRSTAEALEAVLIEHGHDVANAPEASDSHIVVREVQRQGISLAFALRWSESFREWSFVGVESIRKGEEPILGTCVEGIRVEFSTPGFRTTPIFAMANLTGLGAPKTNVARTALEFGPELNAALQAMYEIFCEQITSELALLQTERGFSQTWAIKEGRWLLQPLFEHERPMIAVSPRHLMDAVQQIPLLLIEDSSGRRAVSTAGLEELEYYWTVDSRVFRSAESIIGEVPSNGTISAVARGLEAKSLELPPGTLLCGHLGQSWARRTLLPTREVDRFVINRQQRRLDMRWAKPTPAGKRWAVVPSTAQALSAMRRVDSLRRGSRSGTRDLFVNAAQVPFEGIGSELGIRTDGRVFLRAGTAVNEFLLARHRSALNNESDDAWFEVGILYDALYRIAGFGGTASGADITRLLASEMSFLEDATVEEFLNAVSGSVLSLFDSTAWERNPGTNPDWMLD